MSTLNELQERAKALSDEINELTLVAEPTEEQEERMAEAIAEAGPLAEQIREAKAEKRKADLEELRAFAATPGHVEVPASSEPAPRLDPLTVVSRAKRDPYDLSEVRLGALSSGRLNDSSIAELRSRALDAIEQAPAYVTDEHRESATRHIDRDEDGTVAQHFLSYGSPEYTKDFLRYLRTGQPVRTALSTTAANGGYLIPFHLDPTIILTNNGSVNPIRGAASVATISSNVWHGVSSAGVSAEWTADAAQVADASPTFSQPTITPIRADAYIQASFEVTEDTDIGSQVGMLFADAKDNLEAAGFVTGTGSTQPWGLLSRLRATTASRVSAQTNASFGAVDVFALVNSLPARHQNNAKWLGHWSIYNLVRQFGGANQPNFWVDLGPGIPSQLLGVSALVSSEMPAGPLSSATASTDDILILGDFKKFQIVDRIGMEVKFNPLVMGANNRPTGEVGWAAFWRVGSDCLDSNAFRMLRV